MVDSSHMGDRPNDDGIVIENMIDGSLHWFSLWLVDMHVCHYLFANEFGNDYIFSWFQDLIGKYVDNIVLHESFNELKKVAETFVNNQKNKFHSINFEERERAAGEGLLHLVTLPLL